MKTYKKAAMETFLIMFAPTVILAVFFLLCGALKPDLAIKSWSEFALLDLFMTTPVSLMIGLVLLWKN